MQRAAFRSRWLSAAKEFSCTKSPRIAGEGTGLQVLLACAKPSSSVSGLDALEVVGLDAAEVAAGLQAPRARGEGPSPSA